VKFVAYFALQVITLEEPLFGFSGDLFAVSANVNVEGAMGDEVGKKKFGGGSLGGCRGGRHGENKGR
jgi:hypothetical protein